MQKKLQSNLHLCRSQIPNLLFTWLKINWSDHCVCTCTKCLIRMYHFAMCEVAWFSKHSSRTVPGPVSCCQYDSRLVHPFYCTPAAVSINFKFIFNDIKIHCMFSSFVLLPSCYFFYLQNAMLMSVNIDDIQNSLRHKPFLSFGMIFLFECTKTDQNLPVDMFARSILNLIGLLFPLFMSM